MKYNLKEQNEALTPEQESSRINLALTRKECIPTWMKNPQPGQYNNRPVIYDNNSKGERVVLFADLTALNTVTKATGVWKCDALSDITTSPTSTASRNVNIDTDTCKEILKNYLVAALQYKARVESEPRANYREQKNDIIRCHGRGAYDNLPGIDETELSAQVRGNLQPFGLFKKGKTLSWRNIRSILSGRSKGYIDPIHFIGNLNESKNDDISKLIKESLLTISTNKRKEILQENKIVRNRFKFLIEGRKTLTKKETGILFENIILEMIRMSSTGIDKKVINEELVQLLGTMFQSKNGEVMEMFKEKFGNWIADKVVDVDSEILSKSSIKDAVMSVDNNNVTKLIDCDYLSDLLTRLSVKNWSDSLMKVNNPSTVSDTLRKTLKDTVDNTNFHNDLKNRIKTNVCPLLTGVQDKMNDAESKIKNKVLST